MAALHWRMSTTSLTRAGRTGTCALAVFAVLFLSGCGSSNDAAEPSSATVKDLPAPADSLKPLAFMAGQWVAVNPNKSVNREHWMAPMGSAMTGMFQQMRRDGLPTFYEMTTIVAEKDGVKLYHRHVHRKLELDDRRAEVDVFSLQSVRDGVAVFTPDKDVEGGIKTMTYRADGPDRLVQELVFKPGSKEKDFSTVYTRE